VSQTADREPPIPGIYERAPGWPDPEEAQVSRPIAGRSIGLSVLPIAFGVIGVASILWAAAWFGATDIAPGTGLALMARIIGLTLVAVAILQVVIAYGVWELRAWAWPLGIGLTVAALVLTFLSAGRGTERAQTLSLLLEIGTLWYLLSPRVQEALRPCR